MERRSFFGTLMSEVVPRAMSVRTGVGARARLAGLECLHLTAEQAQDVQAIYERDADRDERARRELKKASAELRGVFLSLDERKLPALCEKMASQRTILQEVASNRAFAICRILDESQRRLFVDMRPARVSL